MDLDSDLGWGGRYGAVPEKVGLESEGLGVALVVGSGRIAVLLDVVLKLLFDWQLEEHLYLSCLLVVHRTVVDELSTAAKGAPCDRNSASAALRSSIGLSCSQDMSLIVCEGDTAYIE